MIASWVAVKLSTVIHTAPDSLPAFEVVVCLWTSSMRYES